MAQDLRRSGPFIAVGAMAVAAFLYGYSAIALPSVLHSLLMPLLWLVLLGVTAGWFSRRPRAALLPPAVAIVAWFALMLLLGPTA